MSEHHTSRRLRRIRRAMARNSTTHISTHNRHVDRLGGDRLPEASHVVRGLR